jgi:hypothetical protein
MTTLADLNRLWPGDHNATPWVATPDGSWTRMTGAGVNPAIPRPQKEGRQNVPAGPIDPALSAAAGASTAPAEPGERAPERPAHGRTLGEGGGLSQRKRPPPGNLV